MNINDVPDSTLAALVRGNYAANMRFDKGTHLLVLAVPYDKTEASTLQEAIEGFRELLTSDDWEERIFGVLQVDDKHITAFETSYENL